MNPGKTTSVFWGICLFAAIVSVFGYFYQPNDLSDEFSILGILPFIILIGLLFCALYWGNKGKGKNNG